MNQPRQIDPAAIERLRRLGGEEFIFKMADLFLTHGAQKIGEAKRAFETANLAEIAKAVHSLKSSAGNIGALEVQDLAAQIERLAAQSQSDSLASLLQELELSFGRTKVDLESRAAARGHGDNASTP